MWAVFGKQNRQCEINQMLGMVLESMLNRNQERCWLIQTAGQWPWKSEPAIECVTIHLPNQLAQKMNGAEASRLVA